ncbi:MAG: bifunctional DNA-formamidopyrimidine glycosylase/DNA-(apurinic or apyrimidinic site) lyase [Candidatus Cloacimonetes bacterium]|nr:bifunctional DNA-formamidopyrimidine glycosylase/DNA-(apurinic or apyrimidinic site) lyase [Candidatus Cloacimonadota bacterium]
MPELPEVEIIKRQLNKEVVGFKIADVWCDAPRMLQPSAEVFVEGVSGKTIGEVRRRAKLLVFRLSKGKDNEGFFIVHLKLSGRLLARRKDDPPDDFVHVILHLVKGRQKLQLRFAEARKFGYMQYVGDKEELEKIFNEFGPEPLGDLTKEKFQRILKGNKRKIKEVLMDQKVIAGVGNIYANEALWLAKIHPETQSFSLSVSQLANLFEALQSVLQEALKEGGASDQWYRQIHGEMGQYQNSFKVYQREDEPCLWCKTPIQRIEVGSRGTFYCPSCQKV